MMIQLATPTRLKITWPRYAKAVHSEIVARLKAIPSATFDAEGECWFVHARQADRLLDAFPKASFCQDTIAAAVEAETQRARTFLDNLNRLGVRLVVEGGELVAVGEGVSPLLQRLVEERAASLRPMLQPEKGR